ncbi:MAG: hypothetical protein RBQ97_07520 [Acholeplasma sp.]|nr:hypothetical protein [Acholeplasma sp.]
MPLGANANIFVSVDELRFEYLRQYGFSKNLGYWTWNTAVMIFPRDTGNAQSSIYLTKNTSKHIRLSYDLVKANYILFLEQGIGHVKKHKGIIGFQTTIAITEQIIGWLKTGKEPIFNGNPKPMVELRESQGQPFSWERMLLKQADMNARSISAQSRATISKIRSIESTGIQKSLRGQRPETFNQSSTKSLNKNISKLRQIYNQRKLEAKGS